MIIALSKAKDMKHMLQSKLLRLIFVALFFYTAFITASHLHTPSQTQHHLHDCKICVIVHNFIAPDLTVSHHLDTIVPVTEVTKRYTSLICDISYQKHYDAQAPPLSLL